MEERLFSIIRESMPQATRDVPFGLESRLTEDLGLNSLGIVSIIFRFEEEFGIDVLSLGTGMSELRVVADLKAIASRRAS
jgi:acyl carrier protein